MLKLIVGSAVLLMIALSTPAEANCFKPASGPTDGEEIFCGGRDPQGRGCDSGCPSRGDCASDYGTTCLGMTTPRCGTADAASKVVYGMNCETFATNAENTASSNDCFGSCGYKCVLNCGSGGFCETHDGKVRQYGYFHPNTYPSLAGALAQWGACWLNKTQLNIVKQVKSSGSGFVNWLGRAIRLW
jgi:hypothetical protein